jgi:D-glycerate 3-kinase
MGTMKAFIERHGLPDHYLQQASIWFEPIVEVLKAHQDGAVPQKGGPQIIGIHGCQGSGKTTLADYLVCSLADKGITACSISLDDFYLGHQQRLDMAAEVHPLFATRGVPGTHDIPLALATLDKLSMPLSDGDLIIPRFNKATDDRFPQAEWTLLDEQPQVIILEGWCMAVPPQEESAVRFSINQLEQQQDPDAIWRRQVNRYLREEYQALWQRLDRLIMLQAPSFSCVYKWRLEQEEKLKSQSNGVGAGIMSAQQIEQFIQHYERLTRHALQVLPARCDHLLQLNSKRHVISYQEPLRAAGREQGIG